MAFFSPANFVTSTFGAVPTNSRFVSYFRQSFAVFDRSLGNSHTVGLIKPYDFAAPHASDYLLHGFSPPFSISSSNKSLVCWIKSSMMGSFSNADLPSIARRNSYISFLSFVSIFAMFLSNPFNTEGETCPTPRGERITLFLASPLPPLSFLAFSAPPNPSQSCLLFYEVLQGAFFLHRSFAITSFFGD